MIIVLAELNHGCLAGHTQRERKTTAPRVLTILTIREEQDPILKVRIPTHPSMYIRISASIIMRREVYFSSDARISIRFVLRRT